MVAATKGQDVYLSDKKMFLPKSWRMVRSRCSRKSWGLKSILGDLGLLLSDLTVNAVVREGRGSKGQREEQGKGHRKAEVECVNH